MTETKDIKKKRKLGRPKTFKWVKWYAAYQELQKESKVSLAEFCRRENLPYDAARKAFKEIKDKKEGIRKKSKSEVKKDKRRKHNWEVYRIEFLEGGFKTLAEFARHKDISRQSATFKKKTKGWLEDRAIILANAKAEKMAELQTEAAKEEFGALHGRVLTLLYACLDLYEKAKLGSANILLVSARDARDYVGIANDMIKGLKAVIPAIADIEGSKTAKSILEDYLAGKIDIRELGVKWHLAMGSDIPDAVKFGVEQSFEEPDDGETTETPTDEELEKRYWEGMGVIDAQVTKFLPQRQEEIRLLKEAHKDQDSFAFQEAD